MRVFFFRGILIVIIAAMAICLYEMIVIRNTYMHEEQVHNAVSAYAPVDLKPDGTGVVNTETSYIGDSASIDESTGAVNGSIIEAQRNINADIAGWVRIPNTSIDYPVVQCADNSFYLTHDILKQKASAGTLFIDNRNSGGFADFNTVIYGHNMKNGSMFGELNNFSNTAFFTENTSGQLFVPDCTYNLEIFACLKIKQDDQVIYGSIYGADYGAFIKYVRSVALQYRDIQLNGGDRIVTLSTCTNVYADYRIVVLARLDRNS